MDATNAKLLRDYIGTPVPAFVPDPRFSQVNTAMTGTVVFKKGEGGDVDIMGRMILRIDPTVDGYYYFNGDTTKTYPLRAESDNLIIVGQLGVGESVTLVLGTATASVQGM